jgi:hypothetical protein
MNALPCTFPVEVQDQVLHAIWRDSAMFMKGTTRSECHVGLPKLRPSGTSLVTLSNGGLFLSSQE